MLRDLCDQLETVLLNLDFYDEIRKEIHEGMGLYTKEDFSNHAAEQKGKSWAQVIPTGYNIFVSPDKKTGNLYITSTAVVGADIMNYVHYGNAPKTYEKIATMLREAGLTCKVTTRVNDRYPNAEPCPCIEIDGNTPDIAQKVEALYAKYPHPVRLSERFKHQHDFTEDGRLADPEAAAKKIADAIQGKVDQISQLQRGIETLKENAEVLGISNIVEALTKPRTGAVRAKTASD